MTSRAIGSRPLRLSRALVLGIGNLGLTVPWYDGANPLGLRLGHLETLRALSLGATVDDAVAAGCALDTTAEAEHLRVLVDGLLERDLARAADHADLTGAALALPPTRVGAPADPAAWGQVQVISPFTVRIDGGWFVAETWDGVHEVWLSPIAVALLAWLRQPTTVEDALAALAGAHGDDRVDRAELLDTLAELVARGMVRPAPPPDDGDRPAAMTDNEQRAREDTARRVREFCAAHDAAVREEEARTGHHKVPVHPVGFNDCPPLALAQIFAYAKVHNGGILDHVYDFRPDWVSENLEVDRLAEVPGVWMFSNYIWSTAHCRAVSERVKELSPTSVTIHGGPDTPKYRADSDAYFRDFPDVDICVRGEGELTAAIVLERLADQVGKDTPPDLSVLEGVEGISYRDGDRVVHNPDRDRIADLNMIPSPFLTGLFDGYIGTSRVRATTETTRGCPYSCTFCDWGSATASRLRKFDLDRVFAEIEWCGKAGIMVYGPADSNFGMLERDVEIARKVAETKAKYGMPTVFGVSFAKNTVRHLKHIISILVEADIMTMGILSLQSMDQATLDAVHRTNIKVSKYEELAEEFREARLPLIIEYMMGLPGSTPASFRNDLQECIDREVQARIAPTELLVNSPMNEPSYREEHKIVTTQPPGRGLLAQVVSTSSYTYSEYLEMTVLRRLFIMCEDFGVLRHLARYARHELGIREIDLIGDLFTAARAEPERWPMATVLMRAGADNMAPPVSWHAMSRDVGRYLVEARGLADDAALASIVAAQAAVLPSGDRTYPTVTELPHDVAAWHEAMLEAKEGGHRHDWTDHVPPLRSFGPGRLVVDDPGRFATRQLGISLELVGWGSNWEMRSPLERRSVMGDDTVRDTVTAS